MIRIDEPKRWEGMTGNPYPQALWSHVWPDIPDKQGVKELHAFAKRLRLKRKWFQNKPGFPHYDITHAFYGDAIRLGAVRSSLAVWYRQRRVR